MRRVIVIMAVIGLGLVAAGGGYALAQAQQDDERSSVGSDEGGAVGSSAAVGRADTRGVAPVKPVTPDVDTIEGTPANGVRTFELTAAEVTQQIANFPLKTAKVWGYNGSTPGPTLLMTQGETIRVVVTNNLPPTDPMGPGMGPPPRPTSTTVHFHGTHMPNSADGVAGISQPDPIAPGQTFTYEFAPEHAGTFAYHSHTDGAVQELRGLDGFLIVQPKSVDERERVDKDFALTVQQFAPPSEGALVDPFPPGTGDFPFSTINGKTSEAAGGTMDIEEGDRVRLRLYNASNVEHSMHLHGHDFVIISRNGHPVPPAAQTEQTTETFGPGDFFELVFVADNPGNWIFHCHVPHHTSNKMMPGYNGSPVGMTRILHYKKFAPVPDKYFEFDGMG